MRCSESWRSERLGRTLRSLKQLASCSIRALPPKFATRSSALIDSNRGTLSATAHWLARSRNVGVDIVESKSRTRALIATPGAAAEAARVAPAIRRSAPAAVRRHEGARYTCTRVAPSWKSSKLDLVMLISSGYGRVTDENVAASAAAASARHHDLTPAGLAAAARSAAAAAVEVTAAQVNKIAQKEGLVLVKARNETGFEGVCFRPAACALLSKPFKARAAGANSRLALFLTRHDLDLTLSPTLTKARYEAGERIEHLGYFSSPAEGALAYARRLGPAACKAAAAAAKRAAPPAPPEGEADGAPKKKKQKQKQK